MSNLLNKKIIKIIVSIIFATMGSLLSFQLMIKKYELSLAIITIIISFFGFLYLLYKTKDYVLYKINKEKVISIIFSVLGGIVFYNVFKLKGIPEKHLFNNEIINPFKFRYYIFSFPMYVYLANYVFHKIRDWIIEWINSLDEYDKKFYIISSIILFIVILLAYNLTNWWFLQCNKIYSLDSGWNFTDSYGSIIYTDVRHPFLNIFTFPLYAIINTIFKYLVNGKLLIKVTAIVLQLIHTQFFIIMAIQLKRLTKNKIVPIVFLSSFSVLLFSIFFEKYQICIFLSFMYISEYCLKKKSNSTLLISSIGAMPTSGVLAFIELFKKENIKEKIFRILKIFNTAVVTTICMGRLYFIKYGINEMITAKELYANQIFTLKQKLVATTKMFHSTFVALPSYTVGRKFLWKHVLDNFQLISLIIIIITLLGVFIKRKEFFSKICLFWILFSFVLFVGLNWSVFETPLFSVYFAWAIIPMFVIGMDYLINKLKLNRIFIYTVFLLLITIVNVTMIFSIYNFMMRW